MTYNPGTVYKVQTCALDGFEAVPVDVEITSRRGPRRFILVGLGDNALRESRERVLSAIQQTGFSLPEQIVVNLAPGEVRKEGTGFDLAIAVGLIRATGALNEARLEGTFFFSELSLDGMLKVPRGILPLVLGAREAGAETVVVPLGAQRYLDLVENINIIALESLAEVISYLRTGDYFARPQSGSPTISALSHKDLCEVLGQETAKRALILAAAGGFHMLMVGPPGCGKSMLAQRLPGLLPPPTAQEKLEAAKLHSLAGQQPYSALQGERPVRCPHFTVTEAGLLGGVAGGAITPGEVSLAHTGVLFFDELPEFRRHVLETLRTPLEEKQICISRARARLSYPANFIFIAAMNPCPCGRLLHRDGSCTCSYSEVHKYQSKISQPLLERIDIHVELEPVTPQDLEKGISGETSEQSQQRVISARTYQLSRQGKLNCCLSERELRQVAMLTEEAKKLLDSFGKHSALSVRSYTKILRVARTIADLEGADRVAEEHCSEALIYRARQGFSG
jgi:magnesium chelatase family protein